MAVLSSRPGQQPQEQTPCLQVLPETELVCQASAKHSAPCSRLSLSGQRWWLPLPHQQKGSPPRRREQGFQSCYRSTEKLKCNH